MDKERESSARDLRKNSARLFSTSSFSPSPSPSGSNINCNGRGDAYAMESCRKERAKGLKGSCSDNKEDCRMDGKCNGGGSEGEEGNIFRPPLNANGSSSRKRIKLQGKVSDDRGPEHPVDPPLVVPKAAKRLRSAINKRISQSASPPLSDSKRGHQHAFFRTILFNRYNGENFPKKVLEEPTKDEEEVAATLISIASLITISKPLETEEDGKVKVLQEASETRATSASPVEAPKEKCTKVLVPFNGTAVSNSIPSVDDLSRLVQPNGASVSQEFDAGANEALQLEPHVALSSNVEPVEGVAPLTDRRKFSSPLGTSLQYFPQNGMLQPKQSDAHLLRKQEIGPWPLGPTSMGHDVQSFNPKPECVASDVGRKASSLQPGLLSKGHEQLTMLRSNKAMASPNYVVSGRPGSANGHPNEKLSLSPADRERQWNKCRTHVHICHLIKNHKKAEKKQLSMSKDNESKAKEGTNQSVPKSREINGSKNMLEVRNQMLRERDAGLLQAQQAAMLSGAYALQKQTVGDTKTSGNEKKSGKFPAPYPPSQVYMPFTFSQGSYYQYQEQLAAGASQQVQLQLPPHYLATGQLYGPDMGHAVAAATGSTTTKQQQQQHQHQHQLMWQAHLAQYRPPMGCPPNWQQSNGRLHDSSSSSSSLVNQPPSIFPLPADFNPQNLHRTFILPLPSPLSSLPIKSKQSSQSSAHLQMISNAESFR